MPVMTVELFGMHVMTMELFGVPVMTMEFIDFILFPLLSLSSINQSITKNDTVVTSRIISFRHAQIILELLTRAHVTSQSLELYIYISALVLRYDCITAHSLLRLATETTKCVLFSNSLLI